MNTSQRILVVEDDLAYGGALRSVLSKAGYETESANSGQSAASMLALNRYDAVLSDIEMPGGTGLQLISSMKQLSNQIPVVLMTGYADRNPEREALQHGAAAYILKPFTSEKLLETFRGLIGINSRETPVSLPDFIEIAVDEFVSGSRLEVDLYVQIGTEGFVKIVRAGDDMSPERLTAFKRRNVRSFFVSRTDFERYICMQFKLLRGMEKLPMVAEKRLGILRQANEAVLKRIFNSGVDRNSYAYAQAVTDANLSLISRSEEVFSFLEALNATGEHLLAHSIGVSICSTMLARKIGWRCHETLRKVSLGGLLHDVGLRGLPKALVGKPRRALSFEEMKLFEKHPIMGAELLRGLRLVPTEVLQIVLQHHENRTGSGYPAGLRERSIFPMARVVALADELCDLCLPSPGISAMEPRDAARYVLEVRRAFVEETLLSALGELFELPADLRGRGGLLGKNRA